MATKDRDVRIDVLVRLQTALFALGAAIDAAQLGAQLM